ncbi:MAG: hypothetical protein WDW38_004021 [Sanguina aurantia]
MSIDWRAGSACAVLLLVAHLLVASEVNRLVPQGYMDEPFHIPQTQRYCSGDFQSWDPKITTFPGLYLLGTIWAKCSETAAFLLGAPENKDSSSIFCGTAWLRSLNIVLSLACYLALLALLAELQQWAHDHPSTTHRRQTKVKTTTATARTNASDLIRQASSTCAAAHNSGSSRHITTAAGLLPDSTTHAPSSDPDVVTPTSVQGEGGIPGQGVRLALYALVLSLFPLHWFFTYLFYTDVGSLLFLALCQLASLRGNAVLAAVAGAVAVLFRQTNAVWVVFVVGAAALRIAGEGCQAGDAGLQSNVCDRKVRPADNQQFQQQQQQPAGAEHQTEVHASPTTALQEAWATLLSVWAAKYRILQKLWPLLLVPAAFAVFLLLNGGVTVGDKAAHIPVKHFAQLLYFSAFCAAMLLPIHLHPHRIQHLALSAYTFTQRSLVTATAVAAVAAGVLVIIVQRYSLTHPYLIADNRHYTFYIFRKVLNRHPAAPYLLLPVYCDCWASLVVGLRRRQSVVWVAGFLACLVLTLVPAWLWELRYYTPGFMLLAVHSELPSVRQLLAMCMMFVAINAATMTLFLYHPFEWADGSVARFMW